jgi:HK97 family phage portal protein
MSWFDKWRRKDAGSIDLNTFIRRMELIFETSSGVTVTPDLAMQSPTVRAVVSAIAARISISPVHVYQKTESGSLTKKELLANHPVEKLLATPNRWQTRTSYWLDATSWLVRYGNFYAFKARGQTGPILRLEPLVPSCVTVEQDDQLNLTYRVNVKSGSLVYPASLVHHARLMSRDGIVGDSPINDVRETIALEIAAEKYGASFFGNGAQPFIVMQYLEKSQGFKTDEERKNFLDEFARVYGGKGRFKAALMPKGIAMTDPIKVENDKAQFLETRKLQRAVIAGAFNVPPHLVGDLTGGTFNNVEQQSLDFVQNVVQPYVQIFEAAMERDLLTPSDRASGIIIRFNLDGALRGDFKSRQEGNKIMRENGALSPNEWREREGMNPISKEDGGDAYWQQGPSGQNSKPTDKPAEGNDNADEEDAT